MNTRRIVNALIIPAIVLSGCDNITGLDNRDAPTSRLTGRVVYSAAAGPTLAGKPVGVRSNEVQLELWEPVYRERYDQLTKIPVLIDQDGSFSAVLFDGQYKLNLLPNGGPWVTTPDTFQINVQGEAVQDFPVTPYYTILNESFTRGAPTTAAPGGSISATFTVGRVNTSRNLELVGVYVGATRFVDRTNTIAGVTAAQRERTAANIATQVNNGTPITITYNLPANIYESSSDWVRDVVFIRVGVKSVGLTPLLYTAVYEMNLNTGEVKLVDS